MVDHSPMAVYEIEQEIDRYIGAPGQATSYMMAAWRSIRFGPMLRSG